MQRFVDMSTHGFSGKMLANIKQCFSLPLNRMRKFICKGLHESGINKILFMIDDVCNKHWCRFF